MGTVWATMTTPANTNISSSSDLDISGGLSAAHDWFMDFIQTRQSILIPCLVVLGIAFILHVVLGWLLSRYAKRMNKEGFQWTGIMASSLSLPLGLAIWAMAFTMVARMLIAPDPTKAEAAILVTRIAQVRLGCILILLGWFLARTVKRIENKCADIAARSDKLDLTAVHAVANFLVVFIWLMTLLIAAQSYGMDMTAILTLGGASAFALSFAFQDVFKNLFGGIMILFSRPFRVGEAVEISTISGSIEKIGIYQTRMRGWDKVPIIIPNSMFLTNPIRNMTGISQRKIQFVIGLRYQDFDQIKPVVQDVETAIKGHQDVDENGLLRVVFNNFGDSSLDIAITCMTKPGASAGDMAALQQELMIKVGEIVAGHGADFAFPTQTLDIPAPIETVTKTDSR
ncbi:MAG: mechanosensitive ion channel family protein [Phycisphaerales bacterium]|nr:mechanosensitive ion channel family protein [Phycisphaerales bacterium]